VRGGKASSHSRGETTVPCGASGFIVSSLPETVRLLASADPSRRFSAPSFLAEGSRTVHAIRPMKLHRVNPSGVGEANAIQQPLNQLIVGRAEFGGKGPSIGCGPCFSSENLVSSIRWSGIADGCNDRRDESRMASNSIGKDLRASPISGRSPRTPLGRDRLVRPRELPERKASHFAPSKFDMPFFRAVTWDRVFSALRPEGTGVPTDRARLDR
jgi:hypothetical protein